MKTNKIMVKLELKREELDYLKEMMENVLDNVNETDYNEEHQKMIEDLYSKMVCVNFDKLITKERTQIQKLTDELNWFRCYGEYIGTNYSSIDGEACSYADGDFDGDIYNNLEKYNYG